METNGKTDKLAKEEIHPAEITLESGLHQDLSDLTRWIANVTVLYDSSLKVDAIFAVAEIQDDYHYTGLCMERDLPDAEIS